MDKTFADYNIIISGTENRTTCPQCSPERHKAHDRCLAVDADKGLWFCHHCGYAGGLKNDKGIIERAVKHFKMPVFIETEITSKKVITYFAEKRGISRKTLAAFKIKDGQAYMPQEQKEVHTIQFPFYKDGKVVNVKYRSGNKSFRQEKDAKQIFYNYDIAMASKNETLIICEGEMDCLSLYECGYDNVVSVPAGAPSANTTNYASKFDFLSDGEDLIDKFKTFILCVDNDDAGKRLEDELSRRIGIEKCSTVVYPQGCKDANDTLATKGVNALKTVIQGAKEYPIENVCHVVELWEKIYKLKESPEKQGISIGWENTKDIFNLEVGQMTIVTGIPSHGKSTFVDAIRVNAWHNHKWASAVFSPENYPAERHLSSLIEMGTMKNFYGLTQNEFYNAMTAVDKAYYFIQPQQDDDMMTVDRILASVRALVFRHGIKIFVLDPFNEVEHIMLKEREDQYISRQLAKIRRFARMNKIHIFIVAHPTKLQKNKEGGYDQPTAYDISGGAMWRNKSDNILCVYRENIKNNEVDVFVQKIRFRRNGKAGEKMKFIFDTNNSTYSCTGAGDDNNKSEYESSFNMARLPQLPFRANSKQADEIF